ncbi:hypothetical protein [Mycobacterium uberis]|nr:hypothetical protein [Mycobacterium uberis]
MAGDTLDLNAVLPNSNAQKYFQAYCTALFTVISDPMVARTLATAVSGRQSMSATASIYHFIFRDIVTRLLLQDSGRLIDEWQRKAVGNAYLSVAQRSSSSIVGVSRNANTMGS